MSFPSVFLWNCWGVGSKYFVRHVLQYIRQFNSNILVLVETRVPSSHIDFSLHKSSFIDFSASKACGFAGGIWVRANLV